MENDSAVAILHSIPRNKVTAPPEGLDLRLEFRPNPEFAAPRALAQETRFRHSSWATARAKTFAALERSGCSTGNLDRFVECGAQLRVEVNVADQAARLSCNKCRNRWCQACGRDRAATITANLAAAMKGKNQKLVTLTQRHSHAPLKDQINGLYEAFSKLRRRAWWKERVDGGAAFLELKVSEKTGLWHVHLHLIVTGGFLPQHELSREWLACTLTSSIVDVRAIKDNDVVAGYVTKYITKPADSSVVNDPVKFIEAIVHMKGRRLCLTWGTWRGISLEEKKPPSEGWTRIGNLWDLANQFYAGDRAASVAMHILLTKYPRLADCLPPPRFEGPDELAM